MGEITTRLTAIQAQLNKPESLWAKLAPAVISALAGLFGVFFGGLINSRLAEASLKQAKQLADSKAEQERESADRRAQVESRAAFIQWQLKQLSELYGPLRALLGQSRALYLQMNRTLVTKDSKHFRFKDTEFQFAKDDAEWVRFRTVLHIREVYGKHLGVDAYFDEIVSIGARIVSVVVDKAGYARPDQPELAQVFGRYLAHYAVLKQVHSTASTSGPQGVRPVVSATKLSVDEDAVFPTEIETLVQAGYDSTAQELNAWRARAVSPVVP